MFENIIKKENENLANYSTVKIGGNAKYIVFPKSISEIVYAIREAKENNLKYFILGNGSNTLFDDNGFDGVVICTKKYSRMRKKCNYVYVDAGVNLFVLNIFLAKQGLGGLEWSYGIPGTIGGLVFMNGGSFGFEICEFVEEVLILTAENRLKRLKRNDIKFEYRSSNLENCVILKIKLKLFYEKTASVIKKMQNCIDLKRKNQPCDKPSLGSVFKRVEKDGKFFYLSKIIDDMGLKGFSVGGAQVSVKHAGFFVNKGGATSADFKSLMEIVSGKIRETGVEPKSEIVILKN